jgi:3-hydroxyisobutyrate dehydrogenase-like beta-hydroxyacid dehydrogenase
MTASAKGEVGVIGLGIMGGAIARNLKAAGWRVRGFDIDPARNRELAAVGIEIAANAGALASAAPTILLSLPDPHALESVTHEIVAAKATRRAIAETSTLALDDKLKAEGLLRQAGHVLLDCPLSGTGAQAAARDLVVYASGDRETIAALMPLLSDFAREAHDLGRFGNGSRMKFVANLLVAIHNVATAEAFVLGMKAGLDPEQIFQLVSAGAGNSRIFELRGPMMAAGRYLPATMKISTWQKDLAVIGDFAAALGCPTPLFSASKPVYAAALAAGRGGEDTAAVCAVLETEAGLKRANLP